MESINKTKSRGEGITFNKSCPVPEWLPEYKKEFRENTDRYFREILSSDELFKEKDIDVTYFQQGVGSIVAKVELEEDIYVIKMTESLNRTRAEIESYKAMTDSGIKVPKLFSEGYVDGYPYFVIEYFDQGTLADKLDKGEMTARQVGEIKSQVFVDTKKILGKGFGWTIKYENGFLKGNFADIDIFMTKWFGGEKEIQVVREHFPDVDWKSKFNEYKKAIIEDNKGNESRFGSYDFQTAHFFASEPPAFFDVNPRLELEYFDLAFHIMPYPNLLENEFILRKMVVDKYQSDLGSIDKEKFKAAIWMQVFRKAANLLFNPDEKRVERAALLLETISSDTKLDEYLSGYL